MHRDTGLFAPVRRFVTTLVLCAMATVWSASSHAGAWLANGTPVNASGIAIMWPAICPDGSGGCFVAWSTWDELGYGIRIKRLDDRGMPVWPAGEILLSPVDQFTWSGCFIVSDGAFGAIVAWTDARSGKPVHYAQRVNSSGAALWTPGGAVIDTTVAINSMYVGFGPDGQGGAVLSWSTLAGDSSIDHSIRAQRIDATGTAVWTTGGVALTSDVPAQNMMPVVAGPSGGATVVWNDFRTGYLQVYAQALDASGTPLWSAGGVSASPASGDQSQPAAIADGSGNVFLSWSDDRLNLSPASVTAGTPAVTGDGLRSVAPGTAAGPMQPAQSPQGTSPSIWAQKLTAAGTPAWGSSGPMLATGPNWRGSSCLASDGAGGAIVAWEDDFTSPAQIVAQRLSAAGVAMWSKYASTTTGYQHSPQIVADRTHGAVISWIDTRNDPGGDLYSMRLDGATGDPVWFRIRPVPVCQALGPVSLRVMIPDGQDGAMFAWSDYRETFPQGCYAARVGLPDLDDVVMYSVSLHWRFPTLATNGTAAGISGIVFPDTLNGNVPTTYFHWSVYINTLGGGPLSWQQQGVLDGETSLWNTYNGPYSNVTIVDYNKGPFTVQGGRHTIANISDPLDAHNESAEDNNVFRDQWVWSPLPLVPGAGVSHIAAPDPGTLPNPNCDGFQWAPTAGVASVVAAAPRSTLDNYDLALYLDYTNSTAGFSDMLAVSGNPDNVTDFFVFGSSVGLTLYPGVLRRTAGARQPFSISAADATGKHGVAAGTDWLAEPMPNYLMANIYELECADMTPVKLELKRVTGTSDLEFAVYQAETAIIAPRGGHLPGGVSAIAGLTRDTLMFTPPAPGVYPVVVYRPKGTSYGPMTYNFLWSQGSTVGVPEPGEPISVEFAGAMPNPVLGGTEFAFAMPSAGSAKLAIYDVSGRCVRVLLDGELPAQRGTVSWDGRGEQGRPLGAGLYWARFSTDHTTFTRRVTLLR